MGKWINEPFDSATKTDEEIRQYCKDQARLQLSTIVGGRHNDGALERAARFATIAQAFRPSTAEEAQR